MDISNDKQAKSLTDEDLGTARKGKLFQRTWISSNSSKKQRHKTNYFKAKIDCKNWNVVYEVLET